MAILIPNPDPEKKWNQYSSSTDLLKIRRSFPVVETALLDLDRSPPLGALCPEALDRGERGRESGLHLRQIAAGKNSGKGKERTKE